MDVTVTCDGIVFKITIAKYIDDWVITCKRMKDMINYFSSNDDMDDALGNYYITTERIRTFYGPDIKYHHIRYLPKNDEPEYPRKVIIITDDQKKLLASKLKALVSS